MNGFHITLQDEVFVVKFKVQQAERRVYCTIAAHDLHEKITSVKQLRFFRGIAKFHPDDPNKFNAEQGKEIAFNKALKKLLTYYSKEIIKISRQITSHKIYVLKHLEYKFNNTIGDNNGTARNK